MTVEYAWYGCEWPTSRGLPCRNGAMEIVIGLNVCPAHERTLLKLIRNELYERADLQRDVFREIERKRAEDRVRAQEAAARAALVYYVQRSDGLIKIGFSGNLPSRLNQLRKEHGPLQVLATHAGGRNAERAQHDRFATLRETGEWFWPEPALLNHITAVNQRRTRVAA